MRVPSRLGDRIPPDLRERYNRKCNEREDQRKYCLACGAANGRPMITTFAALRTRLRAILRILEAEGAISR